MNHSDTATRTADPRSKSRLERGLRRPFLLGFFLVVAVLVVYYPVHNYGFFNVDDYIYVYENPRVLGPLNLSTVAWAFTHTFALNYDPLTFLAHNFDVQLFQINPGRHHEANVVLHALDAVLLFWVLRRATGFTGRSFMVAGLFALHPINVENVAWVSELKTLLSTAFFFLALGAYHWYARRPQLRRMLFVSLLYLLGLLAKPQVITLPFVLLLWDYWPLGRMFATNQNATRGTDGIEVFQPYPFPKLILEKIPLFLIAAADSVITMFAEHKADVQDWPYTFSVRLGNGILSYARYVGKAFWPLHLSYMYPHPGNSLHRGEAWSALLFLIAVSAFAVAQRKRRYLLVGWLWFLGTMVPMIGLVQIDEPAMADRWGYISFIGLFLMVCWSVAELAEERHFPKLILPGVSVLVLIVLAVMTHRQVGYWSDSLTIWTHTLEVTRRNWIAEANVANLLEQQGRVDEALAHLHQAAEEKPSIDLNLRVAFLEHQRGSLQEAILYYQKVLAATKDDAVKAQALANMGHAYSALGDADRAKECYLEASQIHPAPPPRAPRPVINWQGEWWHDIAPFIRQMVHREKERFFPSNP